MTEQEYNTAVKTLSHRLFGYVFKSLRDKEDSNDIVQDAFMKLWENRKKVDPAKAKSWLFTTAHNALINFVKKSGRMSSMDEMNLDRGKSDKHEFELNEIIDAALAKLPEQQKTILLLRDYEGYNYKEIGEIMKLNESQVKVYLFRARKKVKEDIKDLTILKD